MAETWNPRLDDPQHHEHQAAAHLAAADGQAPTANEGEPDIVAWCAMRASMAQAHAALALSIRFGQSQTPRGTLMVVT